MAYSVRQYCSFLVLLVRDVLHPLDAFAVERFCYSDVRQGGCLGRAVPMFFAGLEPDNVPWTDLLNRAAVAPHSSAARGNDPHLAERMSVPGGSSAWLEGYARGPKVRRVTLNHGIDPYGSGKPIGRSFRGGLRTNL